MKKKAHHLISIDPGSSDKGWTLARFVGGGRMIEMETLPISDLDDLVETISQMARKGHVLLGLNAPIKAFGGVQAPSGFDPPGCSEEGRSWPFNVNPFFERPCEKALSSRPRVLNENLEHAALVSAIGKMCGWTGEYTAKAKANRSFTTTHKVPEIRYMSALHGPVVRVFLQALEREAAKSGFELRFQADAGKPDQAAVTVLETNPALTMDMLCSARTKGFPKTLPYYRITRVKGMQWPGPGLAKALADLISVQHRAELEGTISNDDQLDALAGMLNLLDLAAGKADVFGTERDGYFLVPMTREGASFRELWRAAE